MLNSSQIPQPLRCPILEDKDSFCQFRWGTYYLGYFSSGSAGWGKSHSLSQCWGLSWKHDRGELLDQRGSWFWTCRSALLVWWTFPHVYISHRLSVVCFYVICKCQRTNRNKKMKTNKPSTKFWTFHSSLRFPAIPCSWKNLAPVRRITCITWWYICTHKGVAFRTAVSWDFSKHLLPYNVDFNFYITLISGLSMSSSSWKTGRLKMICLNQLSNYLSDTVFRLRLAHLQRLFQKTIKICALFAKKYFILISIALMHNTSYRLR